MSDPKKNPKEMEILGEETVHTGTESIEIKEPSETREKKIKREDSPGGKLFRWVFRGVIWGMIFGAALLVLEGVCRDNLVNGVLGLSETSLVGGVLLALLISLLENLCRWGYVLRAAGQPGFQKERFRGYLGAGFWVTLGMEIPICLATLLGGGVMSYSVRMSTLICMVATLIVMAVLLWKEKTFGGILWPTVLYFLWLAPLTILLPGSEVITATAKSIVSFELVYGSLLCVVALIMVIRNWRKSRSPEQASKKKQESSKTGHPRMDLSEAFTTDEPDEAIEQNVVADNVEDRYNQESVEDKYL